MLQMTGFKFDVELARDFLPVKPGSSQVIQNCRQTLILLPPILAPAGAFHFASQLGLETHHCIFVGDSEEDMECGRRAGMVTVLLDHGYATPEEDHVDIRIKSLNELVELIRGGFHVERDETWPHLSKQQ
jgi:phosphoglycolate phosphatase-like HAD superfamily hydrolase